MANGDRAYSEGLARDNQGLIFKILHNWNIFSGDPREEGYIEAGYLGLAKAANEFDESRGIKFSTYAGKCIINEFNTKFERDRDCHKELMWGRLRSINYADTEDGSLRQYDIAVEEPGPYELMEREDYVSLIRGMVDELPAKDRRIVLLRSEGMSFKKVAEKISVEFGKVTRSGVGIRYKNLVEKLRGKFGKDMRLRE